MAQDESEAAPGDAHHLEEKGPGLNRCMERFPALLFPAPQPRLAPAPAEPRAASEEQ